METSRSRLRNPDLPVLVPGCVSDYVDRIKLSQVNVHPLETYLFGTHEDWDDYDKRTRPDEPFIPVVIVRRD